MKKISAGIILLFVINMNIPAQSDSLHMGNMEIYLIDSYITPEIPHRLVVSFFTSDSASSKISILGQKEFQVSKQRLENHRIEININELSNIVSPVHYKLIAINKNNEESRSQVYEVNMPQNFVMEADRNMGLLQVCCFGGIIFGLPSPTLVETSGRKYFSLTKEIPLFSFYSSGYNYPWGYFGIEYAYIFKADKKNFIRAGYKQIIQIGIIEFISPGINYFSDFKGYNGISTELTLGLFKIQNVFTFFTRYRYNNLTPRKSRDCFHELSIGLYSNFFSINF